MTDPDQPAAVAEELDAKITEYFDTLTAAEALHIAGGTAHQLEAIVWDQRVNELSLRLNTALFAALIRGALIRLVNTSGIVPDDSVSEGFTQFMQVQSERYAAATGIAVARIDHNLGSGQ